MEKILYSMKSEKPSFFLNFSPFFQKKSFFIAQNFKLFFFDVHLVFHRKILPQLKVKKNCFLRVKTLFLRKNSNLKMQGKNKVLYYQKLFQENSHIPIYMRTPRSKWMFYPFLAVWGGSLIGALWMTVDMIKFFN
ncbi:hypothetical protein PCK2_000349, partial [Pneumocystis canis]